MWIDQCVPVKLNFVSTPVSYSASGTVKVIQAVNSTATLKALTRNGVVYGTADVFSDASGWTLMPGERWEGNFTQVELSSGTVVVYDIPGSNQNL